MRVSVAWLREMVDLPASENTSTIADHLTMAGLEVEEIEDLEVLLQGVVVARVTSVEPHPNAERLVVCAVDVGQDQVQIVCGAPNVTAGALVALARPGAVIGGREIQAVKLRGVDSAGMLCSERELGLGDDQSGILLLQEGQVGQPLVTALGPDSAVLEIGVTPNRPDALSHVGVARELAALTQSHLKVPASAPAERGGPIDDAACVTVDDAQGCPRYACRYIEGVEVKESPFWLRQRLLRCGVRSINNVVDATNLILLERGQPLHAFDADKLSHDRGRASIVVRRATSGEKLTTLDGVERQLDTEDLMICDSEKPVALAGIMGGANSEVTQGTSNVLLESAFFEPRTIRRSARRYGLHTEASHRFERGCDPNRGVEDSLNRVAQLIVELAGGVSRRGVVDVYPKRIEPRVVSFRPARAAAVLGVDAKRVSEANIGRLLGALGLEVNSREGDVVHFRIPTWRPDLAREADLIEEVVRLLGMDSVAETLPRGSGRFTQVVANTTAERVESLVHKVLLGHGFSEALSMAFVSPKEDAFFSSDDGKSVAVRNALGEEQSLLRRSLLPRLLHAVGLNQRRGNESVRLFEFGAVFLGRSEYGYGPRPADDDGPNGGDAFVNERQLVAAVAVGDADPVGFDVTPRNYDFFDLKGVLESALTTLGHDPRSQEEQLVRFEAATDLVGLHPRCSARVWAGETLLGFAGELHPDIIAALDLRGVPQVFEFDLQTLHNCSRLVGKHKTLPRFPKVRRDVALILEDVTSVAELLSTVRGSSVHKSGVIVGVDVFDVYRGSHVPPGKKSIALAFQYRSADRTLVDDEVNNMHQSVVQTLVDKFQAEVRK